MLSFRILVLFDSFERIDVYKRQAITIAENVLYVKHIFEKGVNALKVKEL